jgi:hypothetical protein
MTALNPLVIIPARIPGGIGRFDAVSSAMYGNAMTGDHNYAALFYTDIDK